jgi:hypothetical protein
MKQAIFLFPAQRELIKTAMRFNRQSLQGMSQKLFDIAYNKVKSMDGFVVKLDGMEMIYVTQSLHKYGKYLSRLHKFEESEIYRSHAVQMDLIRETFQRENGPKKEKAASAGTLTA